MSFKQALAGLAAVHRLEATTTNDTGQSVMQHQCRRRRRGNGSGEQTIEQFR